MNKVYSCAPLPFQGQKRRFVRDFREVLKRFDDITTVVDLFGGSGLLSHVTKRERPDIRVVYNDYDHFCDRLASVMTTNEILSRIRPVLRDVERGKKVPAEQRARILAIISEYSERDMSITLRWVLRFYSAANGQSHFRNYQRKRCITS